MAASKASVDWKLFVPSLCTGVLLVAVGLSATACAKVRTETRRDILGRPVTTTYKSGPGGNRDPVSVTRGDQPAPIPGSIFGGGGTWYVNGKQVNSAPPITRSQDPLPFLPTPPREESQ